MGLKQLLALGILARIMKDLSANKPVGSGLVGLMGILGGRGLLRQMIAVPPNEGGARQAINLGGYNSVPNYGLPMPTPIPTIINPIPRLPF